MRNFDETEWGKTKSLLREHLTAPGWSTPTSSISVFLKRSNGREKRSARSAAFPLRWLAWSGIAAALLRSSIDYDFSAATSRAAEAIPSLSLRSFCPCRIATVSVSEFRAPDERGVVIWIEGAEYIPAENSVR